MEKWVSRILLLSGPIRTAAKGRLPCEEASLCTLRQALRPVLICSAVGSGGRRGKSLDVVVRAVETMVLI